MTTIFRHGTGEPEFESPAKGCDVQVRCLGLVAAAAGPAPNSESLTSWYELSPIAGGRLLAGVGCFGPLPGCSAARRELRETMWATALAGDALSEMAESVAHTADTMYAIIDPETKRVQIGTTGAGVSALVVDGDRLKPVPLVQQDHRAALSATFTLTEGATLILAAHGLWWGQQFLSSVDQILEVELGHLEEEPTALELCGRLCRAPLWPNGAAVVVHFERTEGSPVRLRAIAPHPLAGQTAIQCDAERAPTAKIANSDHYSLGSTSECSERWDCRSRARRPSLLPRLGFWRTGRYWVPGAETHTPRSEFQSVRMDSVRPWCLTKARATTSSTPSFRKARAGMRHTVGSRGKR